MFRFWMIFWLVVFIFGWKVKILLFRKIFDFVVILFVWRLYIDGLFMFVFCGLEDIDFLISGFWFFGFFVLFLVIIGLFEFVGIGVRGLMVLYLILCIKWGIVVLIVFKWWLVIFLFVLLIFGINV